MSPDQAIKILELPLNEEATEESLKRQYKKMVLKYHPDRNKSPDASKMFIQIKEAYESVKKYLEQRNRPQQFSPGMTIIFDMNGPSHYSTATDSTWSFNWNR